MPIQFCVLHPLRLCAQPSSCQSRPTEKPDAPLKVTVRRWTPCGIGYLGSRKSILDITHVGREGSRMSVTCFVNRTLGFAKNSNCLSDDYSSSRPSAWIPGSFSWSSRQNFAHPKRYRGSSAFLRRAATRLTGRDQKTRNAERHRGDDQDLRDIPIEEEPLEIAVPALESLVAEGKVVRHGFDDSYRLRRLLSRGAHYILAGHSGPWMG